MGALILGGTGKHSLGRQIALAMLESGICPVLVGRSAEDIRHDPQLQKAMFVTADLMDSDVAQQILSGCGDLSMITYLVVAGGGPHLRGKLNDHTLAQRRQVWRTVTEGPMEVVAAFHDVTTQPYHLITVASTSATSIRPDETIYATAQMARRGFALNFHAELCHRSDSKNLIICPGGMRTGLWADTGADTKLFMDPKIVAGIIWRTAQEQTAKLVELTIKRKSDGTPEPDWKTHQL